MTQAKEDGARLPEELAALEALAAGATGEAGENGEEGTEGAAGDTGDALRRLVRGAAIALGMAQALLAERLADGRLRALATWGMSLPPGFTWAPAGSALEEAAGGRANERLAGDAAADPALAASSCVAAPLLGEGGEVLGVLAALDPRPQLADPRRLPRLRVVAARAAAELARRRLAETLGDSEQRLRDLFEEAPIAYVHEDLESRFLSANRAALRLLGLTAEEAIGFRGMSLIPDTPEAQRRVAEAFAAAGRGDDTNGMVLELRRKSDGAPIFLQWWSRPGRDGSYTRTMFIDVTEQILLEKEQASLRALSSYLQEEIKAVHNFEEIVGRSSALRRALDAVSRVADTEATVLITGETGTGKELVARAIHSSSRRRDQPLIKLNCAALPTGLVESELFGHERGAFSGALARRIGRFELAHGGTIFLDEVGEMSLDAQVKLLRVLQERELERVGGQETISVDVRVIAATNRDLRRAVAAGTFREDLYYRLNVFPVQLPPLRERPGDIPLLVSFFLEKLAARIGRRVTAVEPETARRLLAYPWPGNIRELQNLVERALILCTGTELVIEPEILTAAAPLMVPLTSAPAAASRAPPPGAGQGQPGDERDLETVQRDHILEALRRAGGVIEGERGAARQLGLHPNTLRSRMKRLGIRRPP